jgi:hypothetical protein
MKKFPVAKSKGKLGVAFVSKVVAQAGCIFREFSGDTDLGIDGQIEFVERGVATAKLIAVQIKSGPSYLVSSGEGYHFEVSTKRDDLIYWNMHPIPVVLIVYDPNSEMSGWLDIKGYIKENPDTLKRKYARLAIPDSPPFNADILLTQIINLCDQYRQDTDQLSFTELFVSLDNRDNLRGFQGLCSRPEYLFSQLTCFLFFQYLFHPNNGLRAVVTDILSRYLAHPEVGLNPPKKIRDYVEAKLRQFGRQEIAQLLETAWLDEENLMQRGSLGQSAGVIITSVPGYEHYLAQLALDPTQSREVRCGAIELAAEFEIYSVLKAVAANFDLVSWEGKDIYEFARWAAEAVLSMEAEIIDLDNIIEAMRYNDDAFAELLSSLSLLFMCENEAKLEQIFHRTSNPLVRFEASRALDRVQRYKCHPQKYMQMLI